MKVFFSIALIGCGIFALTKSIVGISFIIVGITILLIPKDEKDKSYKASSVDLRNVTVPKATQPKQSSKSVSDGYESLTKSQCRSLKRSFIAMYAKMTGIDTKKDRILEIALVHYADEQQEDEFSSLVKTDFKLYKKITEDTHITQEMVDNAPDEKEVFLKARDFITDITDETPSMIVVYDKKMFDMLRATFSRLGIDVGRLKCFDIYPCAKEVYDNLPNYELKTIFDYAGTEPIVDESFDDETFEYAVSIGEVMQDIVSYGCMTYDIDDD